MAEDVNELETQFGTDLASASAEGRLSSDVGAAAINSGHAFQTVDLSDAAALAEEATHLIQSDIGQGSPADMSDEDAAYLQLIGSPAVYGMFQQLERHGVETVDLPHIDMSNPRAALSDIMTSGDAALRENGIAPPDLGIYVHAAEEAAQSGRPLEDVVAEAEAAEPLMVRGDLPIDQAGFSIGTNSNTVAAEGYETAFADTEGREPSPVENLGTDFVASNYQEYDVHLMAYPLGQKDLPFGLGTVVTRDSHAYVVITEPGGDPNDERDALLVTRAGPDNVGILGSSRSSDSSFGDEQTPTDDNKGNDGDVYVASERESRADIFVPNSFTLERTRITGNLEDIREEISDFRDFINRQDINYELVNRNSNTYAGDIYEKLTGDEPDNPHSGIFGRRTPALGNDLVNYETTEYANDFD